MILSRVAIATRAMTTELDVWSHQAGTNDVNQIRLEINARSPTTSPHNDCDLKQLTTVVQQLIPTNVKNT